MGAMRRRTAIRRRLAAVRTFLTRLARRWIALILLAAFAFGQANIAMATCDMDRSELGSVVGASADALPCEGCGTVVEPGGQFNNLCVAHCTADLTNAGQAPVIVRAPALAPVFLLPQVSPPPRLHAALEAPPPGTRPARVLQHAYLI